MTEDLPPLPPDPDADNPDRATWVARTQNVLWEHDRFGGFVFECEDEGKITSREKTEILRTFNLHMMQAGVMGEQINLAPRAVYCGVMKQALHLAREKLLQLHPELEASLNEKAPSTEGGKIHFDR